MPASELAPGLKATPSAGVAEHLKAVGDPRWFALLLAVAVVVRLPGLNESLWFDELWATNVMIGTLGDFLRSALADVHPPLHGFLAWISIRLFGDSELAVRSLALVSGLMTIGLMPLLGARYASARAGWFAAWLMALSPVHIWYSQEARGYALLMLLAVLFAVTWRQLDRDSPSRWPRRWFIVWSVLLGQLHYFTIALPAVLALSAFLRRRHRVVACTALAASAAGIAMVLGVRLVAHTLSTASSYLRTFGLREAYELFFLWFPLGGVVSPIDSPHIAAQIVGVVLIGMVMLAIAVWIGTERRALVIVAQREHVALMIAVPGLLLVLGWIGFESYYIERSALPSLPFFLLAVGAGLSRLEGATFRWSATGITAIAAIALLVASQFADDRWTVYKPNPDWRSLTQAPPMQMGTPEQHALFFTTVPATELVYYLQRTGECDWPPIPPRSTSEPMAGVQGALARRFPRGAKFTCGPHGTAVNRVYVIADDSTHMVDEVLRAESPARAYVVLNHYWPGSTPALLDSIRVRGAEVRLVAHAKGLDLYEFSEVVAKAPLNGN